MIVKARRIDCMTTQSKTVNLEVEVKYSETLKAYWVYITKGGVTGFESLSVKNMCAGKGGWWACAGTKGRWDSLYVPADQIELIRNTLIKEEHK